MEGIFPNRAEAGRRLAEKLSAYRGRDDAIVLGLPRGGVPVAYEVARQLGLPLDVFVVRKLGVPGYEELAMGAIASGNVSVLNEEVMRASAESQKQFSRWSWLRKRSSWNGGKPAIGRTGPLRICAVALSFWWMTVSRPGATMRAAAAALRKQGVAKIVVAVPVGAPETCHELESEVDEMICAIMPAFFHGVGQFYEDFSQTTDEEVRELLARAREEKRQKEGAGDSAV